MVIKLLNRVDEKIVFHPLTREEIRKIVTLQIEILQTRLADQSWSLEVSENAIDAIAHEGYDPVYGARPLKRVIQQRIANPLASEILKASTEGGQISLDFVEGEYVFK